MRGGAPDTEKQPHFVRRRDGELLYLACLYDVWQPPNASLAADAGNEDADDEIALAEPLHSFTIITMRASREMRFLHDRMPCVLPDETAVDCWLSDKPFDQVHQVLQPYPVDKLEIYQVSPLVNQPRTQRGPDCIMPVDEHRRKRGIAAMFARATSSIDDSNASTTATEQTPALTDTTDNDAAHEDTDSDAVDDDEELRQAIAISLRESESQNAPPAKRHKSADFDFLTFLKKTTTAKT